MAEEKQKEAMISTDGVDWAAHLPTEEPEKRKEVFEFTKGAVYAFLWASGSGPRAAVFQATETRRGSLQARWLAYNKEWRDFGVRMGTVSDLSNGEMVQRCVLVRDEHGRFADGKKGLCRREISHNGRDWVDYDSLSDSDAFEVYEHRRTVTSAGKVVGLAETKGPRRYRCAFGASCAVTVGREGELCFPHHREKEEKVALEQLSRDKKRKPTSSVAIAPYRSSHATMFGGVWSLRG